jgi:hypothetical protein
MNSPKMKFVLIALILTFALVFCSSRNARAVQIEPGINPVLFQKIMTAAGLEAELADAGGEGVWAAEVYVDMQGVPVVFGFPEGGIKMGEPFFLAIDGHEAIVKLTDDGTIFLVEGDERITDGNVDNVFECILMNILEMVSEVINDVFTLQLGHIISAVISCVLDVISCIQYFL